MPTPDKDPIDDLIGSLGFIASRRYGPEDMEQVPAAVPKVVKGDKSTYLVGDDFNNAVNTMLDDAGSGRYDDQVSRRFKSQRNLPSEVADLNSTNGDRPVSAEEFRTMAVRNPTDSEDGVIQGTVASPLIPKSAKTTALARATDDPGWTDAVTDIIKNQSVRRQTAIANVRENLQNEMQAEGDLQRLQQTRGEIAANRVREAAAQNAAIAADKAAFISRSGVNTSELDSKVNQVTARNVQLFEQIVPLGAEIDGLKQISFLDNPLDWLNAQFALPGKVGQYNALANQVNRGSEFIKSQDALVTATNNANAGKMATMNTAEVELAAQQEVVDAQIRAKQAAIASAKLKGASDQQILSIENHFDGLILQLEQRSQQNQDRQRAQARLEEEAADRKAARDDAAVQRKIQQGIMLDREQEKQRKAEEEQERNLRIQRSAAAIGKFGIQSEKDLKNLTVAERKKFDTVYASGGETLGDNPLAAADNWQTVKRAMNNPDLRSQIDTLYPKQQQQLADEMSMRLFAEEKKLGDLEPKMKAEKATTAVLDYYQRLARNPEGGQKDNWYAAPPLFEVAQTQSMVGNLAAKAAMETQAASLKSGGKNVDTQMMLTTLASQVGENKNISQAAEDVTKMYQKIVDNNNATMRFSRYGLPDQTGYPVAIEGKVYDLTKPYEASRALLRIYQQYQATQIPRESFLGI